MDEKIVQEMLHELFSSLEVLDTQNAAILQFLKDKGIASEQELAPYLEQAGNASSVRWLAASVRMNHLLSSAFKTDEKKAEEKKAEQEPPKAKEESRDATAADNKSEEKGKETQAKEAQPKESQAKELQTKESQTKESQKETKSVSEATNQVAARGKRQPEEVKTNGGKETKQESEDAEDKDKKELNKNAA
jgi:hypothetical protein